MKRVDDRRWGLRYLTALLVLNLGAGIGMAEQEPLYDFSDPRATADWTAINDGVMGGVSSGGVRSTDDGTALFSGRLSLESNGGFSSIRSRPRRWDLGERSGIAIRIRGDGRAYKLNLRTDASFDGIVYRVPFTTIEGDWQTLLISFEEFQASFRGRAVPEAPPLNPARITSFGVLISDKQEGPFRLEIAWIAAY